MIKQEMFYRKFIVRRPSDLRVIHSFEDLKELPVGSILHTNDNFHRVLGDYSFVPSLDSPLAKLPPDRKRLYVPPNSFDENSLVVPDTKGIVVRNIGLRAALLAFQRSNMQAIKFAATPSELPALPSIQAWINYNQLYQMVVTGKFKTTRLFHYVMAHIINTCNATPDRLHYIDIPTQYITLTRNDITRMIDKMENLPKLAYGESPYYHFVLHFIAWMLDKPGSVFNALPVELLSNLHFVVRTEKHFMIYNLATLKDLLGGSKVVLTKLLQQFNYLVSDGAVVIEDTDTDEVIEATEQKSDATEKPTSTLFKPTKKINEPQIKQNVVEEETVEQITEATDEPLTEKETQKVAKVIKTVATITQSAELADTAEKVTKSKSAEHVKKHATKVIATVKKLATTKRTISGYTGVAPDSQEEIVKRAADDLDQRDAVIAARIQEREDLTAAQKQRLIARSTAYRKLTFTNGDGKEVKVVDCLKSSDIAPLERHTVEALKDQVFDPSLLSSTVMTMDQQYLRDHLQQDIVKAVTAFRGMHITGIAVKRVDDEINALDTYTLNFEDEQFAKHTVRFTIPVVDARGVMRVNGVDKKMLKQRINIPICQVSPFRVALASNWGKSIIERNEAVAHSFYPKIAKIIENGEFTALYIGSFPHTAGSYLDFPKEEHDELTIRYNTGKSIFTLRVAKEYDKWVKETPAHVGSPIGELQIIHKQKLASVDDYVHVKLLPKEVVAKLRKFDKILMMELVAYDPRRLPYEYTTIARRIDTLTGANVSFCFSYFSRLEEFSYAQKQIIHSVEGMNRVYIGIHKTKRWLYFMNSDGLVDVHELNGTLITTENLIDILVREGNAKVPALSEWVNVRISNKALPIISIFAFKHGLLPMLDYTKTDYRIVEHSEIKQYATLASVVIKLADKAIVISKPTTIDRYLYSGFVWFKSIGKIYLEEMATEEAYYKLFDGNDLSPRYLRNITNFYQLFIDPITKSLLEEIGEPTNMRDLLLRAVDMLRTEYFVDSSSTTMTMLRSYQRFPAIIYNELSRSFAEYKNSNGHTKFTINPFTIHQRILSDQLVRNINSINPVQIIKESCTASHMGEGGRSAERFTVKDRRFAADNLGVMSEATTDDSNAGITVGLAVDANLQTLSGLGTTVSPDNITPAQMLSPTALLIPGTTNDDGKRANFTNIQASHVIPTLGADVFPVCTGYEKVIAHFSYPPYSYVAEQAGKIVAIDEKLKLIKIEYADKSKVVFPYGETLSKNPGGGFHLRQDMELNGYKIGEKFKPGDVLAFNPHFFKPMKNSKQVQFTLGVTANVWLVDDDLTNDDSSYLTEKQASRLAFSPVHLVEVTITKDTNIHQCSLVGTQVSSTDPIMVFDEVVAEIDEGVSEDLSEMLSNLNRSTPRAKHDGVVVSIDVYHTMPTSEMSASVQRTINAIRKMDKEKSAFAEDTVNHQEYKIPGKLETSNRIGIVDLDAETVVFRFYIRATNGMGGGDKLIVSSSLKSVVGGVFPSIGTTASGTEIDVAMAWSSVNKRLVTGCMYTGVAARILKTLGARVVAMNKK